MSSFKKMNNKGSALIIVIIIMTFVGVLATVVLSMTSINAQTKRVDSDSKENFYDAETALDEITLGVENVLAQATNKAYSEIFTQFTTLSNTERNARFQQVIRDEVSASLKFNETHRDADGKMPIVHLLQAFVTNSDAEVVSVASCSEIGDYLKINGLKVEYIDGEYSNTIITDIRINTPVADLSANIPSTSTLSFEKYGLVCENQLMVDNKSLIVEGDVYAGKDGITVHGASSSASFVSDNIITKGDIIVSNTFGSTEAANLSTATATRTSKTNIWAKNIIVRNNSITNSVLLQSKTNTDISFANASVKVKDDLELYSPASKVIMSGDYFGFGYSQDVEDQSSAIIVNGRGSYLDVKSLSSLQLAGRSFLLRPTKFEDGEQKYSGIAMGESLTLRGNQIAYLVPGKCISLGTGTSKETGVGNPLTESDYNSGFYPYGTANFDKTAIDTADFILGDYLQNDGYITGVYTKPNGQKVVYFYLDLKPDKITEFVEKYLEAYPKKLNNMAQIFEVKAIKTNTSYDADHNLLEGGSISAAGNVTADYYITADNEKSLSIYNPGAGGVGVSAIALDESYRYWTSYLRSEEDTTMTEAGYDVNKGVVENMINTELIRKLNSLNGASDIVMDITDYDGFGYRIIIVDNYGDDAFVVPRGMKGMIIATGDVELNFEGGKFTGIIIAGCDEDSGVSNGVVTVKSKSVVESDPKIVKSILGNTNLFKVTYTEGDEEKEAVLSDFFKEPRAGAVTYVPEVEEDEEEQFQSLAGLVVYENWTKE